jgi:hypothetical protein
METEANLFTIWATLRRTFGGGVVDAARDTVGAVAGAVKDFFSGW